MPKATEELVLDHCFKPKQWQHVVISHSGGSALVQPVVRLFVDGSPEANGRLRYPKVESELWEIEYASIVIESFISRNLHISVTPIFVTATRIVPAMTLTRPPQTPVIDPHLQWCKHHSESYIYIRVVLYICATL